jgi:hypothetical protein
VPQAAEDVDQCRADHRLGPSDVALYSAGRGPGGRTIFRVVAAPLIRYGPVAGYGEPPGYRALGVGVAGGRCREPSGTPVRLGSPDLPNATPPSQAPGPGGINPPNALVFLPLVTP